MSITIAIIDKADIVTSKFDFLTHKIFTENVGLIIL